MDSFTEHMAMPRWMMWGIVIIAGVMGYLAYGPEVFDLGLPFLAELPAVDAAMTFLWKWIITPCLLALGGLLLVLLFLTSEPD